MAYIQSNWTVDFAPGTASVVTLLSPAQEIDSELALPWSADADQSKPLRSLGAKRFARGRVSTEVSLTVYHTHNTHAAARNYILARVASLPTGLTATLRIAVTGGGTYILDSAVLLGGDNRMVVGGAVIRTRHEYRICGGRLTAL